LEGSGRQAQFCKGRKRRPRPSAQVREELIGNQERKEGTWVWN